MDLMSSPQVRYNPVMDFTLAAGMKGVTEGRFSQATMDALIAQGCALFRMRHDDGKAWRSLHLGMYGTLVAGESAAVRVFIVNRGLQYLGSKGTDGVIDYDVSPFCFFNANWIQNVAAPVAGAVVPSGYNICDNVTGLTVCDNSTVPAGKGATYIAGYKGISPVQYSLAAGGAPAEIILPDLGNPLGVMFDASGPVGKKLNFYLRRSS